MRAATQIDEIGLPVQRNRLVRGDVGDDLRLVFLAHGAEESDRLAARHHRALHRNILGGQFLHPRLDALQVLGGEGPLESEVVIKTVFDHRADGDLGTGIELLDGVRQQMRAGMADDLQAFRVALGDDGHGRVPVDDVRSVHQTAVHFAGQGGLGQARPDRGGDLADAHRRVERALAAIGERDDRHCCNISRSACLVGVKQ